MTLKYHAGQIEVQTDANTRVIAEMLADWVGPVGEFCRTADLVLLAVPDSNGTLEFSALSGAAPIVESAGPAAVLLRTQRRLIIEGTPNCGGLAISLATARRARLNGTLEETSEGLLLTASEAFTNCRKYIAPSVSLESELHFGPDSRDKIDLGNPWVAGVLVKAETSFLATMSPDGIVDASHRGGPVGFLGLDAKEGELHWDEYVGDGMLKSAGNIRATGRVTLLVPELSSGDALELSGSGKVEVFRLAKEPRSEGLIQHREDFPVQGKVVMDIVSAARLTGLMHPRAKLERRQRVTSASPLRDQAPQ